jgi:hypothetical protein
MVDYLNPDYDLWGRQAQERMQGVYNGYEDEIRRMRQQTTDFNAQQAQQVNTGLMQRMADLQRSQSVGAADLAGQGIQQDPRTHYQMQALQNAANAQNTYQQQQQQMYQNLSNDRQAGVGRMRAAFQSGIQGDVYNAKAQAALQAQQEAAARRSGGGGGGGGGGGDGGGASIADRMAIFRYLNAGAPKERRGLDWLKDNYGNNSGPLVRSIYKTLVKTRGAGAQDLLTRYGGVRRLTNAKGEKLTKTEPINPQAYQMLNDFIKQRNAYHNSLTATPYTMDDVDAFINSGQMPY